MSSPRLMVFFARVGDLVMLTPLLRHLAADGGVELLARPWARHLLGEQAWLNAVHTLEKPNVPGWQDTLFQGRARHHLGATLAGRGFREILIFTGERPVVKNWIQAWRGQAPLIELPFLDGGSRHMVDVYRRAAAAAGYDSPDFPAAPHLEVPPPRLISARDRLATVGARVIAVQAGSSLTHRWIRRQPNLKGLSADQWGRWLARLMHANQADAAVLLGSRQERREAQAIIAATPADRRAQVHDWTGAIGLADLPAVLAASRATLSVDTGPGHIAAAVGSPLIGIFGPTDPAVFAPRGTGRMELLVGSAPCQFCHQTPRWKTCRANICLNNLPDARLDAAWQDLNRQPHHGGTKARSDQGITAENKRDASMPAKPA